ncbi:PadR family transcriptional regulator [Paracoccus sp. M683]|uniref:PadR family transcriptional regulator n=1 Tax=Paracoccus sp. M683 TaxID=2594268 RepID=UPI00117CE4F0|nr:PadR family transcriptional regulator [Paracoccus sp. M683]TRW96891.1 PadR family transcriptional regulator [Paracoccus sp. M683]
MSLRHAILGLLTFQPMSGYALKTRYFDCSIAHFWPADQAQIYRTLQSLEAEGLAESHTVVGETRPNSRVYRITQAGQAALSEWLGVAQPLVTQKDSFLVQLYFGRLISRDQILAVLRARRAEHARLQDYYQRLDLPPGDSPMMRRQARFGGLTLDFARRRETMMLDWLDASIAEVEGWSEGQV